MLTVAVPSLPPPRMLSRWILIVWWGVAALCSAGHLVFFNLVDSDDDLTWWGPIFAQFMICTAWALVTPLAFRIARDLGDDVRPARVAHVIAWGLMFLGATFRPRFLPLIFFRPLLPRRTLCAICPFLEPDDLSAVRASACRLVR